MTGLDALTHVTMEGLDFLTTLFVFVVGLAVLFVVILFIAAA